MTVQELYDSCDSPETTEIFVYANSALGFMPAVLSECEYNDRDIFLDYQ